MAGEDAMRGLERLRRLKVALVHDWLTGMRGGEKCLEVFCDLLPQAEICTLFHFRGEVSQTIERHPIHASFLQRLPNPRRWYRHYLPLFPRAIRSFDLSRFELIISLSHCVAKGAVSRSGAPHLCYCFTPMRYLYDQGQHYFNRQRQTGPMLLAMDLLLGRLRRWDQSTHPDGYIPISRFVAERMERVWGRSGDVIYPPVDVDRFTVGTTTEDFYLIVSALVPYKRIDMAIEAANRLQRKLLIVGKGEDRERLERLAGSTVTLLGWRSDAEVSDLLSRCRAFLLPGEEDFGIAVLEAMASGRPVIALGSGGARETVIDARTQPRDAPTGILFPEATSESLAEAMLELEGREQELVPSRIRSHAEKFSLPRFRAEILEALLKFVEGGHRETVRSRLPLRET